MFSNNNKIIPIIEKENIKISYNDGKCFHCNSKDMIVNDGKPLSFCKRCHKYILLSEYISFNKYKKIMQDLNDIKKTNIDNFLKSSSVI